MQQTTCLAATCTAVVFSEQTYVVIMKREMSGETIRVKISGDQARTAVQNTATASRSPEQATTCFRGVLQQ